MGRNSVKTTLKKAPKTMGKTISCHKKKKKQTVVTNLNDDVLRRMRKQLAQIGCKLHEVEADGNCLFRYVFVCYAQPNCNFKAYKTTQHYSRALSDQVFGTQHEYEQIRNKIVNYIETHRDDFEPFMEDEENFEKYCERMREDGTWGGNQELYATARLFQVYVVVHQDQPNAQIMVIECDRFKPARIIHVAYHGEDHYDSIRAIADPIDPDTLPVSIELDCAGFRSQDFAKRWQTHSSPAKEDQLLNQCISPKAPTDDEMDTLTNSIAEKVSLSTDNMKAEAKTLSKKEQRQRRKAEKKKQLESFN